MSITLATLAALIAKSVPSLLEGLRSTVLNQGKEAAIGQGKALAVEKGALTQPR